MRPIFTPIITSLCRLIWRHWAYIIIVRYFQLSMYLRLNWYSQLSCMQYMGVFSSSNSLAIIVRKYALDLTFVIKTELWVNSSCVGLEHSNNSMHCLLTIDPTFKSGIRIIYLRQIRSNTKSTQKTDRSLRIDCPHWLLSRKFWLLLQLQWRPFIARFIIANIL